MDPHRGRARATVPSWDEIMRRQRRAGTRDRELPTVDGPAAPGTADNGARRRRLTVAAVRLERSGGRADVRVDLAHAGGRASASAQRASVAAAAAEATTRALNELAAPVVRFEVTAVDVRAARVVVELTAASAEGAHRLVGAVASDGRDRGSAAVRATLDAVNRPLGHWLAALA